MMHCLSINIRHTSAGRIQCIRDVLKDQNAMGR